MRPLTQGKALSSLLHKKEPCVKQRMLSGLMMVEDRQQISEASRMLSRSSKAHDLIFFFFFHWKSQTAIYCNKISAGKYLTCVGACGVADKKFSGQTTHHLPRDTSLTPFQPPWQMTREKKWTRQLEIDWQQRRPQDVVRLLKLMYASCSVVSDCLPPFEL